MILRHFLIICLLVLHECSTTSVTGGSGTEVSAIAGSVVDKNGEPVSNAIVRMRPANFLSDSLKSSSYRFHHSIIDTVTTDNGMFCFSEIVFDDYVIEVLYADSLGSVRQVRIAEYNPRDTLLDITVLPMAKISGNVNLYSTDTSYSVVIQVYGIDRCVYADNIGAFSLAIPGGLQKVHIAAYPKDDTTRSVEFDGVDMSLNVIPGENRQAGSFNLRVSPSCPDGRCDSMVTRFILDDSGNKNVKLDSVIRTDAQGRICELHLRGLNFSRGIHFDIIKLSQLKVLDIGNTQLQVMFPNIGKLTSLEVVKVDSNDLAFFSSTIGNCSKLRELYLSDNLLPELPPSLLYCRELSIIDVSNNILCVLDSVMSLWLDTHTPQWNETQQCQ
jgi:Leucine-rich repeat (LRR) protein